LLYANERVLPVIVVIPAVLEEFQSKPSGPGEAWAVAVIPPNARAAIKVANRIPERALDITKSPLYLNPESG
jgi:hypothetical protein